MSVCKGILQKMKELLAPGGKFVFAADTVFDRCSEDSGYQTSVSVKTKEGFDLLLKGKNHYDETSQTQFSPSIYELYNGAELLQSESMDFQTHLYRYENVASKAYRPIPITRKNRQLTINVKCLYSSAIYRGRRFQMQNRGVRYKHLTPQSLCAKNGLKSSFFSL